MRVWRRLSIRVLLLGGTALVLLCVLGSTALLAVQAGLDEAGELFDARLATSARVLDSLMARQVEHATINAPLVMSLPGPVLRAFKPPRNESWSDRLQDWLFGHHDVQTPLGHEYETHIAYQVWHDDEGERSALGMRLLARSSSAPERPFAPMLAGFSDHDLSDGRWRVFALHSGEVWIQVAERTDAREELSAKLAWATGAPLVLGLILLLVLTSLLIGYALAPLSEMAERISARCPNDDRPLELSRVPVEVAPLLRALNALFARVRDMLERERRFIDSAAHELRTPLAALRVHAQNARRADSDEKRDQSLDRLLDGVARSVHLAEQMLAHSRAGRSVNDAPVSLRDVVRDVVQQRTAACAASGHALHLHDCDDVLTLIGDASALSSMVGNLVDNAQRYAPRGTAIEVSVGREGGEAWLSVSDHGPGIPEDMRERVFEPYFRIPGTPGSGTGLGLAIVHEIVSRLGGRILLGTSPGGGLNVDIRMPLADRLPV